MDDLDPMMIRLRLSRPRWSAPRDEAFVPFRPLKCAPGVDVQRVLGDDQWTEDSEKGHEGNEEKPDSPHGLGLAKRDEHPPRSAKRGGAGRRQASQCRTWCVAVRSHLLVDYREVRLPWAHRGLAVTNSRIQPRIHDVDRQVDKQNDDREHEHDVLDDDDVSRVDGVHEALSPRPGRFQMRSMMTVPPRSVAYCTPTMVTMGKREFFSACRTTTVRSERPLDHAVRT